MLRSTESVGALLTGDRRMGKTSLLRKTEQLLSPQHVVLRMSAETDDIELFGGRLLDALRGHRLFAEEVKRWSLSVDVGYKGIRLKRHPDGDAKAEEGTDDLFAWAAARAAPAKLVVIIDEITVLVTAIERHRPGGAVEFLRSLRRPRQELGNVVVILSGSLGLHHAIQDGAPINDLQKVRIGPLATNDAVFLSRCLLLGEEIETPDELALAQAMAEQSDGIPYFVHHLAAAARRTGGNLTPADVGTIRDAALVSPDDPWNVRHYRDRLATYYGADAELVGHMLDAYAKVDGPLDVDRLTAELGAVELDARPNRDQLLTLVERLESDHYLERRGHADGFSSRILRDAWRRIRRL
ncbi:MAG: ATP-binding protein [Actinomycetota bacterium]|nr:ATP-binding protein [Actinomycetota bacterium]